MQKGVDFKPQGDFRIEKLSVIENPFLSHSRAYFLFFFAETVHEADVIECSGPHFGYLLLFFVHCL